MPAYKFASISVRTGVVDLLVIMLDLMYHVLYADKAYLTGKQARTSKVLAGCWKCLWKKAISSKKMAIVRRVNSERIPTRTKPSVGKSAHEDKSVCMLP